MRDGRARAPDQPRPSRIGIGLGDHRRSASLLLLVGLFGEQRHRVRRPRRAADPSSACSCSARCSHAASRLAIGAPLARIKGITGELAARERGAQPAAHCDHRRGGDDRGVARRLHHDLRGVGQRVDQRARSTRSSRPTTSSRRAAAMVRRHGTQPRAGQGDRRAARDRTASTPVRLGQVGINDGRTFVNATDSVAGAAAVRPRRRRGLVRRPSTNNGIAVSKRKADANHWKLGRSMPVTFVKTGNVPLKVAVHLQGQHVRRLLHLADDLREELHRPARLPRSSPSSSRASPPSRAARRSSRC